MSIENKGQLLNKISDTAYTCLPIEDTKYEPTKFLKTNFSENFHLSPQHVEETKYEPKNPKNNSKISNRKVEFISSDSEDDSGIQVLNEFSKNNIESEKNSANLIDLALVSSDCDSDVEHLPYFRKLESVSYLQYV